MDQQRKYTYIVLGMGRTGSTFVTGAIEAQGVNPGKELWGNMKENLDFVKLNKEIYAFFGINGNMGDLPPTQAQIESVKERYRARFAALFNGLPEGNNIIKDPRMTITAPIWLEELYKYDPDPFFIFTARRRASVVSSLARKIREKGVEADEDLLDKVALVYQHQGALLYNRLK